MEVFAKYLDLNNKKTDPALMMLSLAIEAASPGSPGIDGNLSTASSRLAGTDQGLAGLLVGKEKRNDAPPAYLNYLFFDKEMNYKYGGYVQMTEAAYEDGSNREHERLYSEVVAEEPGYFYIYLSNDGTEGGEAFFDDFSILTLESYIVQQTDYYPYGLIARKFVRENERETKELFQGKTYDELTGWYDFHARQYDAALGRWFGVDPQNQFASPYLAMGNNPVMMVDPDGEFVFTAILPGIGTFIDAALWGAVIGGAGYTANVAFSPGGFNNWNGGQFWQSVGMGAVSGIATAGIGSMMGPVGSQGFAGEIGRAMLHGQANMMIGSAFGQSPSFSMYASGALGSLTGSITDGFGPIGQVAGSAFAGGIGAELTGGDFWRGAAVGATVAALNHLIHKREYEYNGKIYSSKEELYFAILSDQAMDQMGLTDIFALGAVIDNAGFLDKRFIAEGASGGTSLASKYGSKLFPQEMPFRLPTHIRNGSVRYTKVVGRFLGRMAGPVGWGILTYDAGMTFYNTQKIYNGIINGGK